MADDKELISKKELLRQTGLSYGQLYRWKRKQLIPEDWFIRKSTYTGQETYFPRKQIMARVDRIQNMKGSRSLDDLAGMFSPKASGIRMTITELIDRNIVTSIAVNQVFGENPREESFSFHEIFNVYIVEKALQSGEIGLDEAKELSSFIVDNVSLEKNRRWLILARKLGVLTIVLTDGEAAMFDDRTRVIARYNLGQCAEELNLKLT